MSDWHDASRSARDSVKVPTLWVAIALSVLVHALVLWGWVKPPKEREQGESKERLRVQLAPPVKMAHPPEPVPPPVPARGKQNPARPPASAGRPSAAPAQPQPAPPVMALNKPEPEYKLPPPVTLPTVAPPPPASARPAPSGDMASYIEARRRARGIPQESPAAPPAPDDETARRNRIVAANITPQNTMTFGYVPKSGGGVFQVEREGFNDAEFIFFGWNKDIRRRAMQRIEVQRGSNPNIRIAIVRKMIEIIRVSEQGDFQWDSMRLGRTLTLSARVSDTAGLEEFMLHEFFDDPRQGR